MIKQHLVLVPRLRSRMEQLPAGYSLHFTQIAGGQLGSLEMRWPRRAEEIYGSLRRVVKPILEKMSVATGTGSCLISA